MSSPLLSSIGVGGVIVGDGGALATAVDVSTGAAVAANNNNAVGNVVPPSSTNEEDAYVGVLVAFEGRCVGAFADGAGESTAASMLLPPPLTLPLPSPHRQAAANVALSRCRNHRSLRAAATVLPLSRCAPSPRFALPPPPLTLPLPPRRRQTSAVVALLRCRYRR
jgi:hypothetical protein